MPLYECAVLARDYGLSVLLLFLAALLYRKRDQHPYLLAIMLALLANSTVQAAMLAGLITMIWLWDDFARLREFTFKHRLISYYLPILIVIFGILVCALFTAPRTNSIVVPPASHFSFQNLLNYSLIALARPDKTFNLIPLPSFPFWLSTGVFFVAVLGLVRRPALFLAAVCSQVAFGVLFQTVGLNSYRHQGLYLVFLLVLYWIYSDGLIHNPIKKFWNRIRKIGFYVGLGILVLSSLLYSYYIVGVDLNHEASSSKAFGTFLNQSPEYREAILVPEPDYLLESLPYYAQNQIYFTRENRFGTTVSWTTSAAPELSLKNLLTESQVLKSEYGRPILIVLGHFGLDETINGSIDYSYNKVFSWTKADFDNFNQSTRLVAKFTSAMTDEIYLVYELK